MDYESEEARRFGGINRWHHLECFIKLREDLEFFGAASSLSGYATLKIEDKDNIKQQLPVITNKAIACVIYIIILCYYCYCNYILFISTDNLDKTDGPSSNKKLKSTNNDLEIKSQNELIFKYRDYLKTLPINICKELLEYNKQEIPSSNLGAVCN